MVSPVKGSGIGQVNIQALITRRPQILQGLDAGVGTSLAPPVGSPLSDSLNITPPREVYGQSPERTREAAMNRLESFFRGGGFLRPEEQRGQSVIADLISDDNIVTPSSPSTTAVDELDIFSPDVGVSSISGTRMPLTGGGDQLGGATFGDALPETVSTTDTESVDKKSEAEDFRRAEETRASMQGMQGLPTEAETPASTETDTDQITGRSKAKINRDLYQDLLDESLRSYNKAMGMAPPKAKTIEQYKKEFSDATGIDISGDPDNKAALTAFGLALMQNKAGKGFNVGRLLSEVGAAGQTALPIMQQARKEAREAQFAAGSYAMTQKAADTATRRKFLIDQENYLRDRRDTVLGAEVARINKIEDREDKQAAAADLAAAKTRYNLAIKELEYRKEAEKTLAEGKEIKGQLQQKPISGNTQFIIHKGMPKAGGQLVLVDAANDAKKFGRGYGNILEAQNTIDNSIRILRDIEASPIGSTAESLVESAQSLLKSLVPQNPNDKIFEDIAIYNTDGSITLKQGISKEALLESMRNGIITEYKRFLTQETGNGISEGDVARINELLGKPGAFKNVAEAIAGLQEARGIFDNSRLEFEDALAQFTNRNNYDSDEAFKLGSAAAQQGIFYGIGNRGTNYQAIDFTQLPTDPDSGLPVFDLTK